MDRSAVQAIVEANLEALAEKLGIPHWRIECGFDLHEDNGLARKVAECTRLADYNRARIEFDPDECRDEAHVLKVLRHELFHVLLSPFDLYSTAVDATVPEAAIKPLDRVWGYAVEQAVINLERMYRGLTPETPEPPQEEPRNARTEAKTGPVAGDHPCPDRGRAPDPALHRARRPPRPLGRARFRRRLAQLPDREV